MKIIARRTLLVGGVCALSLPRLTPALAKPAAGHFSDSDTADLQEIYARARTAGVLPPQAARAAQAPDKLDVAELVLKSLDAAPRVKGAFAIARDAGEVLSSLTAGERDGYAVEFLRRAPPLDDKEKRDLHEKFSTSVVKTQHMPEMTKAAKLILAARPRYEEVSELTETKIPWYVIAALHYREANLNFMGHLHDGDSLLRKTYNEPKNRPKGPWPPDPFDSRVAWRESALDALQELGSIRSWKLEPMLFGFEKYNGFGFRYHGVPSAYVWNYSQWYTHGGFASDGKWSDGYVSKQAGLAPLIKVLTDMTPDVHLESEV